MFAVKRVALYEESGGRLIIHREGSPIAFVLGDWLPGGFPADAAQLAEGKPGGEWTPGRGRGATFLDLSKLPWDRWPNYTGELVAIWRTGRLGWQSAPAQLAKRRPTKLPGRLVVTSVPLDDGFRPGPR
jgi:hypothetical protein